VLTFLGCPRGGGEVGTDAAGVVPRELLLLCLFHGDEYDRRMSNVPPKVPRQCAKEGCPNFIKEYRRKFCSPKCSGNSGHVPSPEYAAARARKLAKDKRDFLEALKKCCTVRVAA